MGIPLYAIPEIRRFYGRPDPYGNDKIDFFDEQYPDINTHVIAARITAENPDEVSQSQDALTLGDLPQLDSLPSSASIRHVGLLIGNGFRSFDRCSQVYFRLPLLLCRASSPRAVVSSVSNSSRRRTCGATSPWAPTAASTSTLTHSSDTYSPRAPPGRHHDDDDDDDW
jgi:hypothetical protein